MTLSATSNRNDYIGNGTSTVFTYTFRIFSSDEILVYVDGVLKTLGADYSVTGVGADAGTVVFTSPPAVNSSVALIGNIPYTQTTDFPANDPFPSAAAEAALDRVTRLTQQLYERSTRSLKFGPNVVTGDLFVTAGNGQFLKRSGDTIIGADITLPGAFLEKSEWVNVKDFGAVGNGSTDDTAAVQNAANAAGGKVLYFPTGTYKVGSITVAAGTIICGAGNTSSVIKAKANNTTIFSQTAAAFATGFSARDLYLDGGGFTGCTGIKLDGTDAAKRLSDIWLSNMRLVNLARGIHIRFCANTYLNHIFTIACTEGYYQDQCADTNYVQCMAQNGSGWGFTIRGGAGAFDEGVRMTACSTNGQAGGLLVNGQGWGIATGCSFTTCSLGAISLIDVDNWRFTACDIASAAAQAGLNSNATCNSIQVVNCFVATNSFGIVAKGTGWTIANNVLLANSNVDIQADSLLSSSITGNVCRSTGVAQSINEANTADFNVIVGNYCIGTIARLGAHTVVTTGGNLTSAETGNNALDGYFDLGAKTYKSPSAGATTDIFHLFGPAGAFEGVYVELMTGGHVSGRGSCVTNTRYHVRFDNGVTVVTQLSNDTNGAAGATLVHSAATGASLATFRVTNNATGAGSQLTSRIRVWGARCKVAPA